METSVEIVRTESADFRRDLKDREAVLKSLLDRLPRVA